MIVSLFKLNKEEAGEFFGCADPSMGKELINYGFIVGVKVKIISKNNAGLVVDILDSYYSLNRILAEVILVRVDNNGS